MLVKNVLYHTISIKMVLFVCGCSCNNSLEKSDLSYRDSISVNYNNLRYCENQEEFLNLYRREKEDETLTAQDYIDEVDKNFLKNFN